MAITDNSYLQPMPTTVKTTMKHFKFYNKQDVLSLTRVRRFETKLGEMVQVIRDKDQLELALSESISRYVIIGIPEDIGVRANGEWAGPIPPGYPSFNRS